MVHSTTNVPTDAEAVEAATRRSAGHQEPTGWVGWIAFAGVVMVIGGTLQAIYGLVAILNDEWVVWGNQANLYVDLTVWGRCDRSTRVGERRVRARQSRRAAHSEPRGHAA
jgi:hypothetical protein